MSWRRTGTSVDCFDCFNCFGGQAGEDMGANQRNGRLDERGMAPVGSRGPAPTAGPPPAAATVGDDER